METRRRLMDAIRADDLSQLRSIVISENINLSDPQIEGHVLLLSAIKQNRIVIANWLLGEDCPVNRYDQASNGFCDTALHVAVCMKNNDLVRNLLKKGAQVSTRNSNFESPLHVACRTGNVEALRLLLDMDKDLVNAVDQSLHSPLHSAVEKNCLDAVLLLLDYGVNVNSYTAKANFEGFTALHLAIINKNVEITQALLSHGADVDAVVGQGEDFQSKHRYYNMKYNCYTPLHLAIMSLSEQMINLLLKHKANVNAVNQQTGITPLHLAIQMKNKKVVQLLANFNVDHLAKTKEGKNILHLAVEHGWCELVKQLLFKNFKINCKTNYGDTPLHIATLALNQNMVKLLLANNVKINLKNSRGQTPLHLAVEYDTEIEITKLLLENGAKVDQVDNGNNTPLAIAIKNHRFKLVSLILSYKPNVHNRVNRDAFLYAIKKFNFYKKIVKILIDYGFLTVFCDKRQNNLALHYVIKRINKQRNNLISMLLRYDVDINVTDEFNELAISYILYQEELRNEVIDDTIQIFVKHIAYVQSKNQTVRPQSIMLLTKFQNVLILYVSCVNEIAQMKKENIFGNVSFYDVLIKKPNALASYGRNKELIKAFKISNYQNRFPLYAEQLKDRMVDACNRASLLESNALIFNKLINHNLPQVVIDNIFGYLNINDLNSINFITDKC